MAVAAEVAEVAEAPTSFSSESPSGPKPRKPLRDGSGGALNNTDLTSARHEFLFAPPWPLARWLRAQLRDERDVPEAFLIFNICAVVLPAAVALFLVHDPSHWLGLAYLAVSCGLFLQRFILCLHYVEHLRPFKASRGGWVLSQLCPYVLCMFYGIPPGIYRLHHIVMHHSENNLSMYDISSTEPYQRDSFLQFLGYWLRFLAAASIELPFYAFRRGRLRLGFSAVMSLSIYFGLGYLLYSVSPVATLWVMVIPFIVASLAMMFGNWSQHIFIDPAQPRNNYALTYNLINAGDNLKTFNDGYHIVHHINSKLHWTELPVRFMETLDKHAQEDALVFEGLGWFDVGFMVFTGQLGALADRYVNIGQPTRNKEELIALLKSRLKPIAHKSIS